MSHRTQLTSAPGIWARALILLVVSTMLVAFATPAAHAENGQGGGGSKVNVCHATNSDQNPYQWRQVDGSSTDYGGHGEHRDAPKMSWKYAGTWNGIDHQAGDPKPDLIEGDELDGDLIDKTYCSVKVDGELPAEADVTVTKEVVGAPDSADSFSLSLTCDGVTVNFDLADGGVWSWNDRSGELALDETSACSITEANETRGDTVTVSFNDQDSAEQRAENLDAGDNAFIVTNEYDAAPVASGITLKKFVAVGDKPANDCDAAGWEPDQVLTSEGETIHWCLKVSNGGQDTLVGIEVLDGLDDPEPDEPAGCALDDSLAPGETSECTYEDTAGSGAHTNHAMATAVGADSGDEVSDDASASYSDAPVPAVSLEKFVASGEQPPGACRDAAELDGWDGHTEVLDGDQLFWCLRISNIGTEELVDISLVDSLDGADATVPAGCEDLPTSLGVNDSMACVYDGTASAGEHRNAATVTASADTDDNTTSGVRTMSSHTSGHVTATAFASYFGHTLAPDASVSDPCAADGISLTLDNTGSSLAVTFEGTDALNGDAVLFTETVAGGDDLVVPVTVAEDAAYDIDVTAVRASDGAPAGTWNFSGTRDCVAPTGTGGTGGGGGTPPTVTPDTDVLTSDISLDKSASGDEFTVGDTVTYTYVVTNTGETTLTSVQLADDVLGSLTDLLGARSLDPGESITVSAMQTLVAEDAGALTNTGTAAGFGPGGERVTTTDTVTVDVAAVLGVVIEAPAPAPAPLPATEPEPLPAPAPKPAPAVEAAPEVRTETEELPRTGVSSTLLATLAAAMLAAGALLLGRRPPTVRH